MSNLYSNLLVALLSGEFSLTTLDSSGVTLSETGVKRTVERGVESLVVFPCPSLLVEPISNRRLAISKQVHLPGAKAGGNLVRGLVTRSRESFRV